MNTKRVLAIYAVKDQNVVSGILARLKTLTKDDDVRIWDDSPIQGNQTWKLHKGEQLQKAGTFLLFASNAFMYSEFIQQHEFKMIIDRYKAGDGIVIPILLENCPWDTEFNSEEYNFSFKELHVLPENRNPHSEWEIAEESLQHIAENT